MKSIINIHKKKFKIRIVMACCLIILILEMVDILKIESGFFQ